MIPLLVPDTNTLFGMTGNMVTSAFGGDTILFGVVFVFLIAFVLLKSDVKASGAVAIGVAIFFVLSIINPAFSFLFYLALVVVALMLVNGLRRIVTGQ